MDSIDFWYSYVKYAKRTLSRANLDVLSLGVLGESGEVCDEVKKMIGHGKPWDDTNLRKELGDILWYCAAIFHTLGGEDKNYDYKGRKKDVGCGRYDSKLGTATRLCKELDFLCYRLARDTEDGHPSEWALGDIEDVLKAIDSFEEVIEFTPYPNSRFGSSFLGTLAEENIRKLETRYPNGFPV